MSVARARGTAAVEPGLQFNAVKVFSATMFEQRGRLGEAVSSWIAANPDARLVDIVVRQSSDAEFHCVLITAFYRRP